MHMADALLSPTVAVTMYAASSATCGVAISKLKKDENINKLPVMAVSAALVFAGQMINYTIPGTGSSGHLCGGMLLSAVLGPYAGFLSMVVILAIQCLFFADGGLMALGANCWNMAFYGCFLGYFLFWKPIMNSKLFESKGEKTALKLKIILASILGCIVTLQCGAFSVVLETSLSGITELPFGSFMMLMQPIHLAIGLIEGLITSAVLVFVSEARPELLSGINSSGEGKMSVKNTVIVLAIVALLTGGIFSHFASSHPDGLEWSLFGNAEEGYSENMGLDEENFGVSSSLSDTAASIQDTTALLPDYGFANSESALGTTVSGIVGSAVVALVAVGISMAGGFFKAKNN